MTTVAYRSGIIASDSRATYGNIISPEAAKKLIVSQRHGVVYGFAGAFAKANGQIRRLESMERLPWLSGETFCLEDQIEKPDQSSTELLVVHHNGLVIGFEDGHWVQIHGDFYALGSGTPAALTAMHMGASAIEAVKMASLVDNNTDDRVVHFDIRNLEPPRYKPLARTSKKPKK